MRLAGRPARPEWRPCPHGRRFGGGRLAFVTLQAGSAMLHSVFGHGRGVYVHAFVTDIMHSFARRLHGRWFWWEDKAAWQACRLTDPVPTQAGQALYGIILDSCPSCFYVPRHPRICPRCHMGGAGRSSWGALSPLWGCMVASCGTSHTRKYALLWSGSIFP